MVGDVDEEVRVLERMSVAELRAHHQSVFGEPTREGHRRRLVRLIAWRLQALREGGLSDRALGRAAELARDSDLRVRPPRAKPGGTRAGENARPRGPLRDPRLPRPGSILRRRYKGRVVLVKVLARGFEHEGEVYASLTAVTLAVTGTHWNGMHFFGLATGRKAKP
ncbi:MAG: DUF2924 domain-containing protein [Phycisphaerales bacterium]